MAFAETAPLIATLDLKGNFASQLKKNQGSLSSFSGSLGRAGRGAGQLGAGFARIGTILGTVAVGGLVGAAKAAISFEDAFAGVRKTVNEADLKAVGMSFESLALDFRKLATEIPIAATEFARIGEAAGALGIKAKDIEEFTKTVALLGVTTNLTTDEAASSLGKIGTILGLTGNQFGAFADILVNLGNQGASTEAEIIEITKRFAAQGKQVGLTTAQILGLSSAIASLGVEPEAGGSALSRIFGNMATNIALADKKGQAFARVTAGVFDDIEKLDKASGSHIVGAFDKAADLEVDRLQQAIKEGRALPEFQKFLLELGKLDRLDAAKALKAAGITNVRDRNAILLMSQNINEVNRQLTVAEDSAGALSIEAQKRFDTVASQLTLLKNNFIEAGIQIGEGMLPAIKNAAKELTAFLQLPGTKSQLKTLGEDVGKAIDSIEWDEVLSGVQRLATLLRGALGIAKTLYDSFMLLPGPVKEAAAGFLVLNKLSGGLIGAGAGNLIGGLAATAIRAGGSRLGGAAGALFAQPVFVTNWAMMAGGGLGGAAGGAKGALGLASKVFLVGEAIGLALLVNEVRNGISEGNTQFAKSLAEQNQAWLAQNPSKADLKNGLAAVEQGIIELNSSNLPLSLVQGEALTELRAIRSAILGKLANPAGPLGPPTPVGPPTPANLRNMSFGSGGREARSTFSIDAAIQRGLAAGFKPTRAAAEATVQRNLERLAAANLAATNRVRDAAASGAAASLLTAAAVQNMDRKPPTTNVAVTVNVTAAQVTKSIVIQKRFGPPNGSRGAMPGDSGV